jgi:hypothetical protein
MTHPKATIRVAWLICMALGGILVLLPTLSFEQEDDPGFIRAIETDSPAIENTYYLQATFNNDTSPYHGLYLYGEGLFSLSKDWGLEADFPTLLTRQPLGQVPLVLGPIGLFLRYEAWHFGGWNSETAGAFSIQAGGSYGVSNTTFRSVGSSWTLEALGGYRVGRLFLQAEYGYQGGIDPKVSSEWQLNNALGYRLGGDWYAQVESDFTAVTSPKSDVSWSVMPQIAFQPGEWLFEWGESIGSSPAGFTELMVARTF